MFQIIFVDDGRGQITVVQDCFQTNIVKILETDIGLVC